MYDSLTPELKKLFEKHEKLRKMRVLMKMQNVVHNKPNDEANPEKLREYD
jgi:hypothetical protein